MGDKEGKRKALTHYARPGRPWLEDNPWNAELGASLGYRTFLMLHKHNEDFEPKGAIESVSGWNQLCDSILDMD